MHLVRQLVAFRGGEPVSTTTLIEIGLFHPATQTAVRDPEIRRDLSDRLVSKPG
jgi:hypothetical protein